MTNTPTRPETMVERVAGAIEMLSLEYALRRLEGMEDSDPGQGIWEEFARAAIEAMRDLPDAIKWCNEMPDIGPDEIAELWQAMITAALGDG